MTVYLVISLPKKTYIHRIYIYIYSSGLPYTCSEAHRCCFPCITILYVPNKAKPAYSSFLFIILLLMHARTHARTHTYTHIHTYTQGTTTEAHRGVPAAFLISPPLFASLASHIRAHVLSLNSGGCACVAHCIKYVESR